MTWHFVTLSPCHLSPRHSPPLCSSALAAAFISACWMVRPTPLSSRSPRKYTATVYFLVLVGPVDSNILRTIRHHCQTHHSISSTQTHVDLSSTTHASSATCNGLAISRCLYASFNWEGKEQRKWVCWQEEYDGNKEKGKGIRDTVRSGTTN